MKLSKHSIMTLAKWILVAVVLVLMMYNNVGWMYYVILTLVIIIVTRGLNQDKNDELIIEVVCDPMKYLKDIKKYRVKKDDSIYSLQRVFGLIHVNELEEAKEEFEHCDFDLTTVPERFYDIYVMCTTRLLFEENDIEELIILQSKVEETDDSKEGLIEYIKVYRSLLEDSKLDTIEQIMIAIPQQPHRLEIYELEYQLAKLYLEVEKYVDSAYVGDFIGMKKYKVIYIDWCKQIAIEAKTHITEE